MPADLDGKTTWCQLTALGVGCLTVFLIIGGFEAAFLFMRGQGTQTLSPLIVCCNEGRIVCGFCVWVFVVGDRKSDLKRSCIVEFI